MLKVVTLKINLWECKNEKYVKNLVGAVIIGSLLSATMMTVLAADNAFLEKRMEPSYLHSRHLESPLADDVDFDKLSFEKVPDIKDATFSEITSVRPENFPDGFPTKSVFDVKNIQYSQGIWKDKLLQSSSFRWCSNIWL